MEQQQKHQIRGYEFHVTGALEKDGRYRGMILVSKRGDTQQVYAKPVLIETASSFKSVHAALIEASAYAQELIYNDAIKALLPADAPASGKQAPQPPDLVGN
ncbi:hypothetical protein [Janthinobacterium sp. 1_2014MBL_MicDiv]|uniref:hypothetical protein n=1 Tax=Janthinobacterium sp. 1_2014MBL_MicDiv TaxID=1644131 RepID=UPI0008F47163|nr:hypothetical protein [Janthinobacterium sp. 1_2014MBL_MicDiv]APA68348.1 hypothetical protein YQ44_11510 [Janthinobacterium sp. 1_2014MBL_MicDiv]